MKLMALIKNRFYMNSSTIENVTGFIKSRKNKLDELLTESEFMIQKVVQGI